jgi:Spy/CpxP family protein refolding chaperone
VLAGLGLIGVLAVWASRDLPAAGQAGPTSARTGAPQTTRGPAPSGQVAAPDSGHGHSGPPRDPGGPDGRGWYPWWKDAAIVKEIGLTQEQAAQIDRIYEQRAKQIAPYLEEYDKQNAELDRMFRERTVEPSVIQLQAAKLMTPRVEIDKSRYVMLYRMSKVLTSDQNAKLQAVFERNRGRGRGGNPAMR